MHHKKKMTNVNDTFVYLIVFVTIFMFFSVFWPVFQTSVIWSPSEQTSQYFVKRETRPNVPLFCPFHPDLVQFSEEFPPGFCALPKKILETECDKRSDCKGYGAHKNYSHGYLLGDTTGTHDVHWTVFKKP